MKNKIYLYWYRHNEGYGNFGDELNPYIISKISKQKIVYFDVKLIFENKWIGFKTLIHMCLHKKISFSDLVSLLYANFIRQPEVLFSIGSILQYKNLKKLTVWGSGIVKKDAEFADANFLAVRGEFTKTRIKELGYHVPEIVGDPAILLPIIYKPQDTIKYKVGIIPHYVHYDYLKDLGNHDIVVINLLDPIEKIIDIINSCEITLSTSLHGIIVSHAYGVPAVWSSFENINGIDLAGDNIKFKDYFSSVEMEYYQPIAFNCIDLFAEIERLPQVRLKTPAKQIIKKIQKDLLSVTPFELNELFKI